MLDRAGWGQFNRSKGAELHYRNHAFDSGGRAAKQYELCLSHGVQIATREKKRGLAVLFLLDPKQMSPRSDTWEPQLSIF